MSRPELRLITYQGPREQIQRYSVNNVDDFTGAAVRAPTTREILAGATEVYNRKLIDDYDAEPGGIRGYHRQLLNLKICLDHYVKERHERKCFDVGAIVTYTRYELSLEKIANVIDWVLKTTIKKKKY